MSQTSLENQLSEIMLKNRLENVFPFDDLLLVYRRPTQNYTHKTTCVILVSNWPSQTAENDPNTIKVEGMAIILPQLMVGMEGLNWIWVEKNSQR